jgi:crotonobetainyl-CoA:carnitine CoA-transferase CaiB-like acyl-CoA transferase
MWHGMCRALGAESLTSDPRFLTNRDRHANRHALWPLLDAAFQMAPAAHWVERFETEQVPVGVVNTLDRVAEDPQILHREMVMELPVETGAVRIMGNPIKLDQAPRKTHLSPPPLGSDTRSVLSDVLGLTEAEIEAHNKAGTLRLK